MIVDVEKISKCDCHGRECSICRNAKATAMFGPYMPYIIDDRDKRVFFYYCEECSARFGGVIEDANNP